jgi:hypothetical protein
VEERRDQLKILKVEQVLDLIDHTSNSSWTGR